MSKRPIPIFETERLIISLPRFGSAEKLLHHYQQNAAYLKPWEPTRSPEFLTKEYWETSIQNAHKEWSEEKSMRLHLYLKETDEFIGTATFSHLERGPFQNCRLGAAIAEKYQGQGYMTEAIKPAIRYIFEQLNYHRIEAGHMLHNKGSGRVLEKLGFTLVGISPKMIRINGEWQDHTILCLINEDWKDPASS